MFKPLFFLTFFLLVCTAFYPLFAFNEESEVQDCEHLLEITLDKLTPLVNKNDFNQVEPLLATIEGACGRSEFTQRIRILKNMIERGDSKALIQDYLDNKYDEALIMRWDYSLEQDYKLIYNRNKADFNFIPLKHPIDLLIQLKAEALLKSASYNLNEQEEKIMLLFANRIMEYDQVSAAHVPQVEPTITAPDIKKEEASLTEKVASSTPGRSGISIYAGLTGPLGGINPTFGVNPSFAVMYSSKLTTSFIYELGMRVRINTKDRDFDYQLYNDVQPVNSKASFSFSGTLGYKVFDNQKYSIAPKFGLAYETTTTGISEITDYAYYDDFGDYTSGTDTKYHNVNNMRLSLGLAAMRHIHKNQYIGIEASYIYSPYNWSNNLVTTIQSNYGSIELFYRF